jgi:hypothetical protein
MGLCFGPDDLKICPADSAILDNDCKTCALSLYLQADSVHTNCDRRVYAVPPSPTLLRHGSIVVYHSPGPRQIFFRCRKDTGWETSSVTLHGSGMIEGASSCHVTTSGLHLRPVFHARTSVKGHMPPLYMPNLQVLASSSELETVRRFTEAHFFENVGPQIRTQPSMADLTAWYQRERKEHSTWFSWVFPSLSALATIFCVYILYIILTRFHEIFRQPWHYCARRKMPAKDSAELAVSPIPTPDQVRLEALVPVQTGTGSDKLETITVEPAPRYVKH